MTHSGVNSRKKKSVMSINCMQQIVMCVVKTSIVFACDLVVGAVMTFIIMST
jgi:hypothetical protein